MDELILKFFESIRNPALTGVFSVFSLFGEPAVITAIVVIVFWLAPKRTGEPVLVTALTSYCLNSLLKYTVHRKRPYAAGVVRRLDPPLGASLDENASFPSGHAQMTTAFFGALAARTKRVLLWGLCALPVLLIMLARLYFGVHYPSDVLMGFLCGLLLSAVWALVYRLAYDFRHLVLLFFALLSLVPLFFSPSKDYVQAAGLLCGGASALVLASFMKESASKFPRRLLRIPVGVAILAVLYVGALFLPEGLGFALVKYFFLSLGAIVGGEFAFEKLQI